METVVAQWIDQVKAKAEAAHVFAAVTVQRGSLHCAAPASAAPATFRLDPDGRGWAVSLVTEDRWLSESIEADLMHHGDPIEELIEEELVELGMAHPTVVVKHYRDEQKLYTFRSPVPLEGRDESAAADIAATWLLAYEAAFRQLGDMETDKGEA
jgi:hypothetical protein